MDESVKFAWAYLLMHGMVTNGEWCQHSGFEEVYGSSVGDGKDKLEEARELAIVIGIDWEKTKVPKVSNESVFNDTFSPNSNCLATLGKLYLKNGKHYFIGSSDDDAAHLAETARKLIEGKESEATKLAGKL
jgi:hypothetical protein